MRLLAAGVFLLLWPVNVPAESSWLTLLTGCLGAGLLLAALWGLRRVNPSFSLSLGLLESGMAYRDEKGAFARRFVGMMVELA